MRYHSGRRPVVIGAPSAAACARVSQMLDGYGVSHSVVHEDDEDKEAIMSRAGQEGAVTVIYGSAGRGYDISLSEAVKQAGGLVVLGGGPSLARRTDAWLRGLAGRGGEPGESRFSCRMRIR